MRKVLTLVIISIFILIVIKFKDLADVFDFSGLKEKFSTVSFFKKKLLKFLPLIIRIPQKVIY